MNFLKSVVDSSMRKEVSDGRYATIVINFGNLNLAKSKLDGICMIGSIDISKRRAPEYVISLVLKL